ncbi:hypothetical protein [Ascidiimonas sp. W6]|uniref:hypothetical protein n=1 Tax=Ascidiimonas meishanensis TaxID=3128903 RepID=UPI0030ED0109
MEKTDKTNSNELNERVSKVELKLLEQEHRIIPAILNIFKDGIIKKKDSQLLELLFFSCFQLKPLLQLV